MLNRNNYFGLELTNYLKLYHDCVYFLCLCPFRIVRTRDPIPKSDEVPENGIFKSKSWLPQKICCAIITILGFPWLIRDIRLSIPKKSSDSTSTFMKDPTIYFGIMLNIVGTLLRLAVTRVFWRKSEEVSGILNFLVEKSSRNSKEKSDNVHFEKKISKQKLRNIGILLICFIYTANGTINWVQGRALSLVCYGGSLISKWDSKWWWAAIVEASKYSMFMETNTTEVCAVESKDDLGKSIDVLLGIFGSLGFYYKRVLGAHCNCFLLMATLTLWTAANRFSKSLPKKTEFVALIEAENVPRSSNIISWHNCDIYKHYLTLKQLTKLINSVYGPNVTLFLTESILYYAVTFDDIFVEHGRNYDYSNAVRLIFYFGNTCAVLWVAADVSKQMNYFKEWLSLEENRRNIGMDHLYVVINELDTHVVAIKGSNIFPVTYSLAAKLLGVTVTYFIICVQV